MQNRGYLSFRFLYVVLVSGEKDTCLQLRREKRGIRDLSHLLSRSSYNPMLKQKTRRRMFGDDCFLRIFDIQYF